MTAKPARGYSWPPFEPGNELSLRHGARSPRKIAPIASQLLNELVEVAPWCARDAFAAERSAWAHAEARCRLLRAWVDEHGILSDEGLQAATELHRAETHAANLRVRLGLAPSAMAKLLASLASASGSISDNDGLEQLRREGALIVAARMPDFEPPPDDEDHAEDDQPDDDTEPEEP